MTLETIIDRILSRIVARRKNEEVTETNPISHDREEFETLCKIARSVNIELTERDGKLSLSTTVMTEKGPQHKTLDGGFSSVEIHPEENNRPNERALLFVCTKAVGQAVLFYRTVETIEAGHRSIVISWQPRPTDTFATLWTIEQKMTMSTHPIRRVGKQCIPPMGANTLLFVDGVFGSFCDAIGR